MARSDRDAFREEIQRLFAAGDLARCRARLAAGLEKWPGDPELLNDSGVVAYAEGKLHEAIGLFRAALALKPGDLEASENHLRSLLGAGLNHAAWRFLRESGRTSDSLTQAPEAVRIAVAVTVPGAGRAASPGDLDRCVSSIREQTYPVSEILIALDAASAASSAALRMSGTRRIDLERRGAPTARRATLLATRADAIVWVDADVALDPLWIEIALRELYSGECAGSTGRLLEVHDQGLADQWRAVHEGADPGLVASDPQPMLHGGAVMYRTDALAGAMSSDTAGASLLDRALGASLRRRGLVLRACSDAVAWRHRRDTLESVLDDWCAEETARLEAEGVFSSTAPLEALTLLRAHYATLAFDRLHADVSAGRPALAYPDFLLFFWSILRDVEHLGLTGRVPMATCVSAASTFLSQSWKALDPIPGVPSALLDAAARRVLSGLGEFGRSIAATLSGPETTGSSSSGNPSLAPLAETLVSVVEAFGPALGTVWNAVAVTEGRPPALVPA
ncbi:MAG: glycosyltransferase family 2 protein [Planctomycetes bacterium]|nr:glycosyltransferase family 2 protein [Planctomycetota bacterium]MBI3842998.1 glycosyltransferase family 2 protein [Planctomycetota bacterium]